ncbi:MAG: hypothetical protein IK007_06440 [Lachnospiraceae bacterium]|nr:hypothetical protein [Lachnospiraceae bacterium]
MNADINKTLRTLLPILQMNNEKVTDIEAVRDWYKGPMMADGTFREVMKEVAEITYENGAKIYADIDCDSKLCAVYDILAVVLSIKPEADFIQRIERNVYD